ncbi:selenium-dependent molybdenum cofactor biosynthesis protein YqeB [Pelotomaculum propionicicum]|uniref:selenium-dependent molybdenum cofactor biosynthesis protein YqeB n=1 Tax=Pelotomaculum propionicicum TaxID=258475 RepID=UPI003B774287
MPKRPLIVIKGAGDLATGVAYRLYQSRLDVIMTEINRPLVVRRKVAFAEAVHDGMAVVEGITAKLAVTVDHACELLEDRIIPVLVDPEADVVKVLRPQVVVDARVAKRNLGTAIDEAPLVIGLGPGFTAGQDVHAVIETCRGHRLGRVIYSGSAIPDTGSPGSVGGFTVERLLRAPADGVVMTTRSIGEIVEKGEIVAVVENNPVRAQITGKIRGMIKEGIRVPKGTKIGDIDPRKDAEHDTISDKALAVGGGVLEAVFSFILADNNAWCN